jgi:hypothetical protein
MSPRAPSKPFVCRECGYDLSGLLGPDLVTCPECGVAAVPRKLDVPDVPLSAWKVAVILALPWIPGLIFGWWSVLYTAPPLLSFLLAAGLSGTYARMLQRPIGEQLRRITLIWTAVNTAMAVVVAIRSRF